MDIKKKQNGAVEIAVENVVNRLSSSKKKRSIMEFAGKWPGGKEELDKIKKIVCEDRKKFKLRKVDFWCTASTR